MKLKLYYLELFLFTMVTIVTGSVWQNITMNGDLPARQFPTIAIARSEHVTLLYGGVSGDYYLNDTYFIKTDQEDMVGQLVLDSVIPQGSVSPHVGPGCTAVWNKKTRSFYMFGGGKRDTPDGITYFNSNVWKFDYDAMSWSVDSSTSVPPSREYHTTFNDEQNNRMIIFGGRTSDGDLLNDMWAYDYLTTQWAQIVYVGGVLPTPRWGHALGAFPEQVLLFGGLSSTGPQNDLYTLNFSISDEITYATWQNISYVVNSTEAVMQRYQAVAFSIVQTDGTSTTSKLVLYGGITSGSSSNDTYLSVYEVETNTFWTIHPNGTGPSQWPLVGITSSGGFFFYDGTWWTQYASGTCADGELAEYEECDDGNEDTGDGCEVCYIQLCDNGQVDPGEECDGGPLCSDDCTCPPPFFSDGGTRNGCIPAAVTAAFILMIFFPVFLFVMLIGLIVNFVIYTKRANKSIIKVLFL